MDTRQEGIARLREIVQASKKMVFFGGAGVSTESGIPDFRSQDGLYRQKYKYPPEYILSRTFFDRHTEEFFEFYREKMLCLNAQPNAAHYKLAQWEREGKLAAVITQNIDGLHQKAGSHTVLELHGSIWRNVCMDCGALYPAEQIAESAGIPRRRCGGVIKPDGVLYEEPLDGTSLNVQPAVSLIDFFRGKNAVVINRGAPARSMQGVLFIDGKIGEVFSAV